MVYVSRIEENLYKSFNGYTHNQTVLGKLRTGFKANDIFYYESKGYYYKVTKV